MNRTDRSSKERVAACRAALTVMGMGDYLHLAEECPWEYLEDRIVCDSHGKAVICRNDWGDHIARAVRDVLDRKIELLRIGEDGRPVHVFTSSDRLSIPERHTIAAITRYFDMFRPGLRSGRASVVLPGALRPLAAPANFLDEADAFELAAAIKTTFGGWGVDVTATDEGFAVVV